MIRFFLFATIVSTVLSTAPEFHHQVLSQGLEHACSVTHGELMCWGDNTWGQIGESGGEVSKYQTRVYLHGVKAVAVHCTAYSTCVLLEDGTVQCMGSNNKGILGVGRAIGLYTNMPTTVEIPAQVKVIQISGGIRHMCALLTDYNVACWGFGPYLGLDIDDNSIRFTPQRLGFQQKIRAIASSPKATWGILEDGTVAAWGMLDSTDTGRVHSSRPINITNGQSGEGYEFGAIDEDEGYLEYDYSDQALQIKPRVLDLHLGTNHYPITSMAVSAKTLCVLLRLGNIRCWSNSRFIDYKSATGGAKPYSQVVVVEQSICALTPDHEVYCWGMNVDGNLGIASDATKFSDPQRVQIAGAVERLYSLTSVSELSKICAQTSSQTLCWGGKNQDNKLWEMCGETVTDLPEPIDFHERCRLSDSKVSNQVDGLSVATRINELGGNWMSDYELILNSSGTGFTVNFTNQTHSQLTDSVNIMRTGNVGEHTAIYLQWRHNGSDTWIRVQQSNYEGFSISALKAAHAGEPTWKFALVQEFQNSLSFTHVPRVWNNELAIYKGTTVAKAGYTTECEVKDVDMYTIRVSVREGALNAGDTMHCYVNAIMMDGKAISEDISDFLENIQLPGSEMHDEFDRIQTLFTNITTSNLLSRSDFVIHWERTTEDVSISDFLERKFTLWYGMTVTNVQGSSLRTLYPWNASGTGSHWAFVKITEGHKILEYTQESFLLTIILSVVFATGLLCFCCYKMWKRKGRNGEATTGPTGILGGITNIFSMRSGKNVDEKSNMGDTRIEYIKF